MPPSAAPAPAKSVRWCAKRAFTPPR
jgi:hypothetical protein